MHLISTAFIITALAITTIFAPNPQFDTMSKSLRVITAMHPPTTSDRVDATLKAVEAITKLHPNHRQIDEISHRLSNTVLRYRLALRKRDDVSKLSQDFVKDREALYRACLDSFAIGHPVDASMVELKHQHVLKSLEYLQKATQAIAGKSVDDPKVGKVREVIKARRDEAFGIILELHHFGHSDSVNLMKALLAINA